MKALLFDLDGVIVDTAKYHFIAWKQIAEELGINFTLQDNERLKGVSRMRSFEIILEIGNVSMSEQGKEDYCTRKNEIYLDYIRKMGKEEVLPGVKDFIMDAKTKGYKVALGSASKNAVLILERLELIDCFDEIIDGTKISSAKPDPEVFTAGAKSFGLTGKDCIVFEDAVAGVEAAHRGGMKAVGIGTKEALPDADCNISGFDGLIIEDIENMLK